nr:TonB-dependent receptor plug domain-containing protein [Desulfuromonadales bacterium]NIS39241.1 TonB-dependent receptor plug domain-containing protein [Desulfuromonadales bacterium]
MMFFSQKQPISTILFNMPYLFSFLVLVAILSLGSANKSVADETSLADSSPERTLPAVVVIGATQSEKNTEPGSSTLSAEEIGNLPLGAESISESVKILPGVQLSEEERSSRQGGEILPPDISISGGRPFQNNFSIDGLSNNSSLDPELRDSKANSGKFIPDHAQDVFLDPELVDSIDLYRSNISAKYGEFTGGVVDAETRDPDPHFWGKISVKGTRDEWTTFHMPAEERQEFENSDSASDQPDFTIYDANLTLNVPTGQHSGLLASYSIVESEIPLNFLGGSRNQKRELENFFLKYQTDLTTRDTLSATLLYTPYEEKRFYRHARNSDFTIEGGGALVSLAYERFLEIGELQIKGAY